VDDTSLRQLVLDELAFEPSLEAAHIGVSVSNGVVTLWGHVRSYPEKIAAEKATQHVKGVRAVAEEIEVRDPGDPKLGDADIARRAAAVLAWIVTVPDGHINVSVEDRWITLSGDVDWQYQRADAAEAVRKLSGVRGLTNLLRVLPYGTVSARKQIEGALKRSAEIDEDNVQVRVDDGRVTLEGKVRTVHERKLVERAAWAMARVSSVENRLSVG